MQRFDTSVSHRREGTFEFLNRVAGAYWDQIRDLIEGWFVSYPTAHSEELRSRLRSDGSGFWGAYWELLLHEILRSAGIPVKVQPELSGGGSPDFLVRLGGEDVIVEARVQMEPQDAGAEATAAAIVRDSLSGLRTSDYWIDLEIPTYGSSTPSANELLRKAQTWVDSLDVEVVRHASVEGTRRSAMTMLEVGDWRVRLTAILRGDDHRHETQGVHLGPAFGRFVDDHDAIRKALIKKVRKYRGSGLKMIIATSNLRWTAGREEMMIGLYGVSWEHPAMMLQRTIDPSWRNVPEGVWVTRNGPQYQEAIAVLVGEEIWPWSLSGSQFLLYHRPDDDPILEDLPFGHLTVNDSGKLDMVEANRRISELLGVGDDWPEGEPFP